MSPMPRSRRGSVARPGGPARGGPAGDAPAEEVLPEQDLPRTAGLWDCIAVGGPAGTILHPTTVAASAVVVASTASRDARGTALRLVARYGGDAAGVGPEHQGWRAARAGMPSGCPASAPLSRPPSPGNVVGQPSATRRTGPRRRALGRGRRAQQEVQRAGRRRWPPGPPSCASGAGRDAQTVAARPVATVSAGRPARAARARPAAVSTPAAPRAAAGLMRPGDRAVRAVDGVLVAVGPVVEEPSRPRTGQSDAPMADAVPQPGRRHTAARAREEPSQARRNRAETRSSSAQSPQAFPGRARPEGRVGPALARRPRPCSPVRPVGAVGPVRCGRSPTRTGQVGRRSRQPAGRRVRNRSAARPGAATGPPRSAAGTARPAASRLVPQSLGEGEQGGVLLGECRRCPAVRVA